MTLLRRLWDAAAALDPDAARLDESHMPYSRPDELRELWREAGLEDLRTTALVAGAAYSSFDDLWQPLEGGVGPAGAYVGAADGPAGELRDELRRRLAVGDGPFRLTARARGVAGRVP